jgi:MFS family permease
VASAGALIAAATKNPFMFIVAVSLLFLSLTIYHPASYSFTTRLFEPKDRAKALGLHGAGGTFGMAIGPISISILMGTFAFGWRQVYFAWFFPLILGVIAVFFIRTEPTEDVSLSGDEARSQGQATKLFTSSLVLFLVFGGLRNVGMRMTRTFLSVWLVNTKGWELAFASMVFGASSLMGILAAPLGGLFASRYGEKRWTVMTLIVSYTCFALAFLIPGTLPFVALYLSYGFFNFLSMAANSAIMAKLSPSGQRGLGFALYFLPGSVMGAIAPMIAAWIADAYGIYTIFMCSVGILIAALTLLNFGVKVD